MDFFDSIPFFDWFASREFQITPDHRHVLVLPAEFPFLIRCYDFSATYRLVPNTHDYFEINYVHRGRGVMHVENAGYEIRGGDLIGEMENYGQATFDPPGLSKELDWLQTGRGCDWVLVLDDLEGGFGVPGTVPAH